MNSPHFLTRFSDLVAAKTSIQNSLFKLADASESIALLSNYLPSSLINKAKIAGQMYVDKTNRGEMDIAIAAMAVGTILKELDNGNTTHVTVASLTKLMNYYG